MSRWLHNVGNFLEKLDDQAERVVDEQLESLNDDNNEAEPQDISSILASRGLQQTASKDNEEDDDGLKPSRRNDSERSDVEEATGETRKDGSTAIDELATITPSPAEEMNALTNAGTKGEEAIFDATGPDNTESSVTANKSTDQKEEGKASSPDSTESTSLGNQEEMASRSVKEEDKANQAEDHTSELEVKQASSRRSNQQPQEEVQKTEMPRRPISAPMSLPSTKGQHQYPQDETNSKLLQEAQKEARTLRRHVVSLNSQLECAEREIQAQREELERAGDRLEKDRSRFKQELEKERSRQTLEVDQLRKAHEQTLAEAKRRADAMLEEVRTQMRDLEQRRMQEGGNTQKELSEATHREQQAIQKLAMAEQENAVLLSQISTLQAQQDALGSRLESLTQTADNAMTREREAEDRLDEALSLHARQLSQRNTREAQLEKTVAELGAALVSARGKGSSSSLDQRPGDSTSQSSPESSPEDTLREAMENEIEAVRSQLTHEHQRNDTLQKELEEITKERTAEASLANNRQMMFDRREEDMNQEIAKLKRDLLRAKDSVISLRDSLSGDPEDSDQIKSLSEDVMRQREIISNSRSEISALKSRLAVAVSRAEQAETAAELARNTSDHFRDVERAAVAGVPRKRIAARNKNSGFGSRASMKDALQLDSFQNEGSRRLGETLDSLDTLLAKIGTVLRGNPIARLMFRKFSFEEQYKRDTITASNPLLALQFSIYSSSIHGLSSFSPFTHMD